MDNTAHTNKGHSFTLLERIIALLSGLATIAGLAWGIKHTSDGKIDSPINDTSVTRVLDSIKSKLSGIPNKRDTVLIVQTAGLVNTFITNDSSNQLPVESFPKKLMSFIDSSLIVSVEKGYCYDAPNFQAKSKSYILKDETVLVLNSHEDFFQIKYVSPYTGKESKKWMSKFDFDIPR